MNPRFHSLLIAGERRGRTSAVFNKFSSSDNFGSKVFNRSVMQKMLPPEIYANIVGAMEGREKIKQEFADPIAVAMKEWAINLGATHYCHWFQPLTGAGAEKHDSFIEWSSADVIVEKFTGKQLIQGEPDASSFPSGGLRSTFEARGYTGWDPTSPVFVWKAGDGITLCIPSLFFSWTGAVLDNKIPLLRSDKKLNNACLRLLKLTGVEASSVHSTIGMEQEYFVVDRALRNLRPDLMLLGRTVQGAASPKGQELQDHYFGSVKDRILSYMHDFEVAAIELGIPVKTRHNEVAPAQHEIAPVYENASIACDHNILLMELMRQYALKHDLCCLLHEKPFNDLNGSGKHCNWSLITDRGLNLLDPTAMPENNLHFLVLLAAVLAAVHKHAPLIRASVGSASNDFRLGGHEAPPAILSVYLGDALEDLLVNIEKKGSHKSKEGSHIYDLGLHVVPELRQDNTDRNRTSPLAFTGNKFEFRAVGSSASAALPITVLNAAVAESLNEILDQVEEHFGGKKFKGQKQLLTAIMPVLKKSIKASKPVRYAGDNYSEAWVKEAKNRGLPNILKSIDAFESLKSSETAAVFEGILTREELASRYEILVETYSHTINIEAKLILELFKTLILPAALKHQKMIAKSIQTAKDVGVSSKNLVLQSKMLDEVSHKIHEGLEISEALLDLRDKVNALPLSKRGKHFADKVFPKCEQLRAVADALETLIDDEIWPLPKYRELLYLV